LAPFSASDWSASDATASFCPAPGAAAGAHDTYTVGKASVAATAVASATRARRDIPVALLPANRSKVILRIQNVLKRAVSHAFNVVAQGPKAGGRRRAAVGREEKSPAMARRARA
jgi:hypothetical protein